ncbi:hypothetical protein H5410_061690 [Solanum commersonii]|uniref:Uncharacterized protein n=1 Tax=Solanum commersonii TaxID=4109 RepID=A0A9J5W9K1_SOLCO|nr:hypothetical protein H5410_061690 [Solanum commersonii]
MFTYDVYAFLNPGASLLFVIPYIDMKFSISPEQFLKPLGAFTSVGDFIIEERVYHDCTIFVNHKDTIDELVDLDIVYFDVILGMDWLHAFYSSVDCRT